MIELHLNTPKSGGRFNVLNVHQISAPQITEMLSFLLQSGSLLPTVIERLLTVT